MYTACIENSFKKLSGERSRKIRAAERKYWGWAGRGRGFQNGSDSSTFDYCRKGSSRKRKQPKEEERM